MQPVHFANGFQDERLKRVAFILTDEIEQYLTLNKFLDHDTSVEFFNNKITSAGFVINPIIRPFKWVKRQKSYLLIN